MLRIINLKALFPLIATLVDSNTQASVTPPRPLRQRSSHISPSAPAPPSPTRRPTEQKPEGTAATPISRTLQSIGAPAAFLRPSPGAACAAAPTSSAGAERGATGTPPPDAEGAAATAAEARALRSRAAEVSLAAWRGATARGEGGVRHALAFEARFAGMWLEEGAGAGGTVSTSKVLLRVRGSPL